MSLMCSSTGTAQYFSATSSNRRATGSASDEHWVALNKNTFLEILNEILSQSAIPTPEMTSYAPVRDRSPTYVCVGDHTSLCRGRNPMSLDTLLSNADTSGFPRYSAYATSPFVGCRQWTECDRLNIHDAISEWNFVEGRSHWSVELPSSDVESTTGDDSAATDTATDLTTVNRRRPQACRSTTESFSPLISSSQQQSAEAADICHSLLDGSNLSGSVDDPCTQSPSDIRAKATDLSVGRHSPHVDNVREDLEQQLSSLSVTSSLNGSFDTASLTAAKSQAQSRKAQVSPRASWMVIDKTLLRDVVDQMLFRDKMLGLPDRRGSTFPVDKHSTGSSSGSGSRNPEMAASTRGDFMLCRLLGPKSTKPEPELPQQPLTTSSLYWRRSGSSKNRDRLKKRSTYAAANFSSEKRRCCDSDCRNLLPFPEEDDDINCSDDDDDKTRGNMAHSPSLKWKSTMLLRMRTETPTSASRSPVTAAT